MATYFKVPRSVPGAQRASMITEVEEGDRIPFDEILGRPARGMKLIVGADTDEVVYKVNHRFKTLNQEDAFRDDIQYPAEVEEIWSGAPGHTEFTVTGDTEHIITGFNISTIEIVSLDLDSGTEIEIMIW